MKIPDYRHEMKEMAEAWLDDDKTLILTMKGFSMYPTLRPGDKGSVVKCNAGDLKSGDIVVFKNQQHFVAHRLIRIVRYKNREMIFYTRGDHNTFTDNPFTSEQLIGKLKSFSRNDKIFTSESFYFHFHRSLHLNFHRFSLHLNFLYEKINQLKRIPEQWRILTEHFRLIVGNSAGIFWLNVILAVLQGVMPLLLIILFRLLVDNISNLNTGNIDNDVPMWLLLGATAIVFFTSAILTDVKAFTAEKLSQSVNRYIYHILHKKHLEMELEQFENPSKQDKIHRAVQEASYRPLKLLNDIQVLFKSVVSLAILSGIFLTVKWYLILIIILAVLPSMLLRINFARKYYHLKEKHSSTERKMYYFNRILTGLPFAKEMKLFGFVHYFKNLFTKTQNQLFRDKIELKRKELIASLISELWAVLLLFSAIVFVIQLTMNGALSIGILVMFLFAFQRGFSTVSEFLRSVSQITEDNVFLRDFTTFVSQEFIPDKNPIKSEFSLRQGIRFENVCFSYETSQRPVLNGINLTIEAGKTIALVGENGSGKTTLIKLLCGFYMPVNGRIFFDNQTSEELGQATICANTGAVFQDFALYNLSLADNLRLGNIQKDNNPAKLHEAVKFAGIENLVESLPEGINTILGNQFLGGEELSFGQWQKIAIARAFYRDAPLLLLDEPSSALDARSESLIIQSLKNLTRNKTAVIVSHRLRTVQWVDQICFMEDGRITELGTHEELMILKGKYFELYQYGNS